MSVLILPGLHDSDAGHWQSRWEAQDQTLRRLRQDDWETPRCADWMATLDEAVERAGSEIVLVAHSLSCALVAHWAVVASPHRVHGALLVAPADPLGIPAGPQGFAPMPMQRFGFPSIVVASTTDPFVTIVGAAAFAAAWGSTFVNIGDAGHINTGSGFGEWPEGLVLLRRLQPPSVPTA